LIQQLTACIGAINNDVTKPTTGLSVYVLSQQTSGHEFERDDREPTRHFLRRQKRTQSHHHGQQTNQRRSTTEQTSASSSSTIHMFNEIGSINTQQNMYETTGSKTKNELNTQRYD